MSAGYTTRVLFYTMASKMLNVDDSVHKYSLMQQSRNQLVGLVEIRQPEIGSERHMHYSMSSISSYPKTFYSTAGTLIKLRNDKGHVRFPPNSASVVRRAFQGSEDHRFQE